METEIVNAFTTFAYGGGIAVVVSYFNHIYNMRQLQAHKEDIDRVCQSFDAALDRFNRMNSEIITNINERNP